MEQWNKKFIHMGLVLNYNIRVFIYSSAQSIGIGQKKKIELSLLQE